MVVALPCGFLLEVESSLAGQYSLTLNYLLTSIALVCPAVLTASTSVYINQYVSLLSPPDW